MLEYPASKNTKNNLFQLFDLNQMRNFDLNKILTSKPIYLAHTPPPNLLHYSLPIFHIGSV